MKLFAVFFICFIPLFAQAVAVGETAPEFTLSRLDQSADTSLASSHGKIRYLDFWASWCAPCRVSLPEIVKLQNELGGDRFEVIAINVDENPGAATKFLKRFPVNYQVLSDPTGKVAAQYELPGMPTSFVVDPSGKITLIHTGFRKGDMASIRAHIESLLSNEELRNEELSNEESGNGE